MLVEPRKPDDLFAGKRFPLGLFIAFLIGATVVPILLLAESAHPFRLLVAIGFMALCVCGALVALRRYLFGLARERDLYETMFEAMPCYAVLLDRKLHLLWSDRAFKRDFAGRKGSTCHELFREQDAPCSGCIAQKTFQDGGVYDTEQTVTTAQGDTLTLILYSSPISNALGEVIAVLEIAVNISSVKEMQKQLVLLGQTVAGMAHSIKNIMMGLDGGIYVVNRGLEADNQEEVKEGWDMVHLNFEKISRLVKDILYCSKEREPELQRVDANEVVREVYDLYRDSAKSFHIELKLELDERLGESVVDPSGLHTVLTNLVSNAMDACKVDLWKDSHLVEVKTRRGADGSTILEISDNGVGMDQELRDRAFEDFFTSKGNLGTGLGLMVTQKVVREHGGTISFDSSPGKGTTFTVVFPSRSLPPPPDNSG
jgi:signal transduction histidine kinase